METKRFWRTLVRVTRVYSDEILVILPGWDRRQEVRIKREEFPMEDPQVGDRTHARVNIGAHSLEELEFKDWER